MNAVLIALAIPLFLIAIGVEALVMRRETVRARLGEPGYRFADAIASLSCGIGQQMVALFLVFAVVGGYDLVYTHARLFEISSSSPLAWVALLLGVDLLYYGFHRASHRVNVIWATHAVHHQSEEYNLTTALRQSWIQGVFSAPFYWPLALLGFPTAMFVLAVTINTLYQFWIHTRAVGKLGPIEWIFNTPSHHRVHHGIDPRYIDKNYAGMLIVWDRMFGTFLEEDSEPVFGTVKPLSSFNPTWANAQYWIEIGRLMRRCPRLADKLRAPFMPPEWRPAELGGNVTIPEVSRETRPKYGTDKRVSPYALASFVVLVAGSSALLVIAPLVGTIASLMFAACVLLGLSTVAGLVEERRWARPLEVARLLVQPIVALYVSWGTPLMALATAITAVVSLASLVALYASRRRADALPSTPAPAR